MECCGTLNLNKEIDESTTSIKYPFKKFASIQSLRSANEAGPKSLATGA